MIACVSTMPLLSGERRKAYFAFATAVAAVVAEEEEAEEPPGEEGGGGATEGKKSEGSIVAVRVESQMRTNADSDKHGTGYGHARRRMGLELGGSDEEENSSPTHEGHACK